MKIKSLADQTVSSTSRGYIDIDPCHRSVRHPLDNIGFTTVELLVVVAIIGILAALLLPALQNARDRAQTITCASNLHQWAIAIASYASENSGDLPGTTTLGWGPYPFGLWQLDSSSAYGGNAHGQLSVEKISPYLSGLSTNSTFYSSRSVWICPVFRQDLDNVAGPFWSNFRYCYFARVSQWASSASRPQDLTDNELRADRLLMCDIIFRYGGSSAWAYNHSRYGPSFYSDGYGTPARTGPPAIRGINRLFGDGHVEWKPSSAFNPTTMETIGMGASDPTIGYVRAGPDPIFY